MAEQKKTKRKSWTKEETELLLKCYKARSSEFEHARKKKYAYANVLEDMTYQGFQDSTVTESSLHGKMRTLITAYKSAKDNVKQTGAAAAIIPYMDELDEIFGSNPIVSNNHSINVGSIVNMPSTAHQVRPVISCPSAPAQLNLTDLPVFISPPPSPSPSLLSSFFSYCPSSPSPSLLPTLEPSPSLSPSLLPTLAPSPSLSPSLLPTLAPSPSLSPSLLPTLVPSSSPSPLSAIAPSTSPSPLSAIAPSTSAAARTKKSAREKYWEGKLALKRERELYKSESNKSFKEEVTKRLDEMIELKKAQLALDNEKMKILKSLLEK